jgi:hypothetical protein
VIFVGHISFSEIFEPTAGLWGVPPGSHTHCGAGPVPAVGEVKNITNGNEMQEKNMTGRKLFQKTCGNFCCNILFPLVLLMRHDNNRKNHRA